MEVKALTLTKLGQGEGPENIRTTFSDRRPQSGCIRAGLWELMTPSLPQ